MDLGPMEIGLILLAALLLFGYKKLPDASRSLGRSLRIFKSEMKGLADDGRATPTVLTGELDQEVRHLEEQARAAEALAAEARARADAAGPRTN